MKNFIQLRLLSLLFFLIFITSIGAQTCSGGTSNIPVNGSIVINGITVNSSSSGYVKQYTSSWNGYCASLSAGSLFVGDNPAYVDATPAPWQVVLSFSKPVSSVVILLSGGGNEGRPNSENFVFSANIGAVSISSTTNCYATISGNTIYTTDSSSSYNDGGGIFKIQSTAAFTQLTISGNGGLMGSLMGICSASVVECAAGVTKPPVQNISNTCPTTTANLDTAHTGTAPGSSVLRWYTNSTHTGTPLSGTQISQAGVGTYYAFYYDSANNCYSPASAVNVTINSCGASCFPMTSYSSTGWKAKVYDAPAGTDAWSQISSASGFPTSSYTQVATFDYNEYANTNTAFNINFDTLNDGLRPSNPKIQNYVGTQIYNDPSWFTDDPRANADYAVLFSKTIGSGEEGTYKFDLNEGDDHIFIYKNGFKISQIDNAYNVTPINNFATITVAAGDVISVLVVEEYEINAQVQLIGAKQGTVQPPVKNLSNVCPVTTVNLNSAHTGTASGSSILQWYTNNTHTGTPLSGTQISQAGVGTYYAFYYDSANNCYSSVSSAVNVTISNCVCYADPNTTGTPTATKHGITLLQRAGADNGNWPMIRKSAHTVLESNTKGFVITRMSTSQIASIVSPQEGMMVYDTDIKCLKLYDGTAWSCFSTPTCP